MIKKTITILMLFILLMFFSNTALEASLNVDTTTKDYFINHTYEETGSKNIVTGIYLDYRLFDTIFETSILIIAVSGIIYMTKRDDEVL